MTLDIHWVTQRYANGVINAWHSYLPPVRGGILALGAFDGEDCVGVLVVSRPKARMLDNGRTLEVCRVATNGHPNAASQLLGRSRRLARDLGFVRLVSYTREGEAGTSYRAAGWCVTGRTEASSWKRPNVGRGIRRDALADQPKLRWEVEVA